MRNVANAAVALILCLLLLPPAFAWSGATHEDICLKIGEKLGSSSELARGCRYPDVKGDFQNHICHGDWCPAKRKAQLHLEAGRNLLLDGRRGEAAFQFGMACHYISDSLQPYHTNPSSSQKHRDFEGLVVSLGELAETESSFDELNAAARNALESITDSNAPSLASEFANKAMALCFAMIKSETQNRTMAEIPDCSSVELVLRNDDCHLRDVRLAGKIRSPLRRVSQAGNEYTVFYLSDGREQLRAFTFGSLALQDGALADVEGTYYKERKTGNYWFYEELDVTSVREQGTFLAVGIAIALIFVAVVAIVLLEKSLSKKKRG